MFSLFGLPQKGEESPAKGPPAGFFEERAAHRSGIWSRALDGQLCCDRRSTRSSRITAESKESEWSWNPEPALAFHCIPIVARAQPTGRVSGRNARRLSVQRSPPCVSRPLRKEAASRPCCDPYCCGRGCRLLGGRAVRREGSPRYPGGRTLRRHTCPRCLAWLSAPGDADRRRPPAVACFELGRQLHLRCGRRRTVTRTGSG